MIARDEISSWFDRGVAQSATHMIVVCDTSDYEDYYPVFVNAGENARDVVEKYSGKDMQKLMEVYNLSMDKNEQLAATRCFNY